MTTHEWARYLLREKDEEVALIYWTAVDILALSNKHNLKLSRKDAFQALYMADKKCSPDTGLSSDYIKYIIESYLTPKT